MQHSHYDLPLPRPPAHSLLPPYLEAHIVAIRIERHHVHRRIVRIIRKAENRPAVRREAERGVRGLCGGCVCALFETEEMLDHA